MKKINWSDHLMNFLAVIIGVSLAFFVNDSAERRKEAEEYQEIVDSFLKELESDKINYVEYQIPDNKEQLQTISEVLQKIQAGDLDSLYIKFERAININNYHPSNVTFNSLISSGKLDLISDFELRKRISTYHTGLVAEAENRGKFQVEYYMNHLLPWLLKNTNLVNPDLQSLQQIELVNILVIYQGWIMNKVDHYEYLVQEIESLQEKLLELKEVTK